MKNFFKMVFASCLGVLVSAIALIFIGVIVIPILVLSALSTGDTLPELRDNTILKVDVSQISEVVTRDPLQEIMSLKGKASSTSISLTDAVMAIRSAKNNPNIKGIYLNLEHLSAGMATIEQLRRSLIDFKSVGKFIYAYADNYSQKAYYLSSVADKILLNPEGGVSLLGVASGNLMMRSALDNLGIKMEVFKVGTYKGAVEPYILDKLSEPNRDQIQTYIDGLWTSIVSGVADSRGLSADSLRMYANRGDLLQEAQTLVDKGIVDSLVYRTDIPQLLVAEQLPKLKTEDLRMISLADMAMLVDTPSFARDRIAVVYAEGEIADTDAGMYGATGTVIDYALATKLREFADKEDVKAVVLRINSPGGSAFLSEQIWREVVSLKKKKPVVVSMGDLAASGGYYIASGANEIVAEANTLTGSIGIFGMVPNAEQLARKIGVSMDIVKTSEFADLEAGGALGVAITPMSPQTREQIQLMVERGYKTFLSRVAQGRGMTLEQVDSVGQGRVWLGSKALELGLVDRIGGLDTAIERAALLAKLSDYSVDYDVRSYSLLESLLDDVRTDKFVARVRSWAMTAQEREVLRLMQLASQRTGIQARLPYELIPY